MTHLEQFTLDEIPYHILQKYGLTEEMMRDLPQYVEQKLLSGRKTPALKLLTTGIKDGKEITFYWPTAISLKRMQDGTVDVCFAPLDYCHDLSAFNDDEQQRLKDGITINAYFPSKGDNYIQYRKDIGRLQTVPTAFVERNIQNLLQDYNVSDDDMQRLKDGEVIEIRDANGIVSVGVDLEDETCLRICAGSKQRWLQQRDGEHKKYYFVSDGCWVRNDDNQLEYVAENNFTEDMKKDEDRNARKNMAEQAFRQMNIK